MTNTTRKTKGFRLILLSVAIVLVTLIAYHAFPGNRDSLQVKTYRVAGGWGYKVLKQERVYIDQPFIPVLPGRKPFPDRKSALRAAKTVKAKLLHGKLPSLTRDDILNAGLDSLGNSN